MSTIVTRAGKGSALTHNEVDANFTNLNTDKVEKSGTDPVVISVNSSSNALRITQVGAGNALLVEDSTNPDATPFVVDATGNVGIGTTTPVQPLEVVGAGLASRTSKATNADSNARLYGGAYTGNLATFAVVSGSLTNNLITIGGGTSGGEPATAIAFNTGTVGATGTGTERMRIDSSGNVGIGTSSPVRKLHVAGSAVINNSLALLNAETSFYSSTNPEIYSTGTGGTGIFNEAGNLILQPRSSGALRSIIFATGNPASERLRIDSSGNVGIGTSSPDALLTVNTAASFGDGSVSAPSIAHKGDLNTGIYFPAADTIAFSEGGVQVGEFDSSANFKFNSGYGSVATAYGCRAWVNFDGTSNTANLTGSYVRTSPSTTLTVSATAHGLITGNRVYLDFTSGTALDGEYVVTRISADSFTVTTVASTSTSGAVTIRRNTIRASGNVSSVSDMGTGLYAVNFAVAMPDANYAVTATSAMNIGSTDASVVVVDNFAGAQTAGAVQLFLEDVDAGGVDSPIVMVVIHR
jgi:hypothetical protein